MITALHGLAALPAPLGRIEAMVLPTVFAVLLTKTIPSVTSHVVVSPEAESVKIPLALDSADDVIESLVARADETNVVNAASDTTPKNKARTSFVEYM